MTEILDLAKLSRYVYEPSKYDIPKNWIKLHDSDDFELGDYGYYGAVFINCDSKEIVIASSGVNGGVERGYLDLQADLFNAAQIMNQEIPEQFTEEMVFFIDETIHKLNYELKNGFKIKFTGHSMGGLLSDIGKEYSDRVMRLPAESISFDNPGSLEIIKKVFDVEIKGKILGLTIYNSNENAINKCNSQAGEIYFVESKKYEYIGEETMTNVREKVSELFHHHNLDHIILAIEKEQFHKVESWPSDSLICKIERGFNVIEKIDSFIDYIGDNAGSWLDYARDKLDI